MDGFLLRTPLTSARVQRVVDVLQRHPANSWSLGAQELAKDQLPETDPDNGGQAR